MPVCQIGREVGRKGMPDPAILPLLRTLRRATFVSWDRDFFHRSFAHKKFCLVFMDVRALEVADYVRRLLRHPAFKTWTQRKGRVIRFTPGGISAWEVGSQRIKRYPWSDRRRSV